MTINGYSLLRLLSERERSRLYLARDAAGHLCAIKLQKPRDPAQIDQLIQRDARLQPLTRRAGLLTILAHGATEDGWSWEALPLADNLLGLPPVGTVDGQLQYTPLTLLAWRTAQDDDPPPARQMAAWGAQLADALATLHGNGLVHRDVKPANVLFFEGQPCLGDYGLVGEPGEIVDYRGTEGFQPLEGTSDTGADLFALGKTLYETWTGGNRLEFPSLPRRVLDAPDWNSTGSHLNEVILHACNSQPSERFHSALELSAALVDVSSGRRSRSLSRRRWLVVAAGCAATVIGLPLFLKLGKAPARLVWRRVRDKGFKVECWQGHAGTADWIRGQIYSFCVDSRGRTFQALDLARFTVAESSFSDGPTQPVSTMLHPQSREVWIIEGGDGEVFSLNPGTLHLRSLGGGPHDERHFGAMTYWNPITRRVGSLGGYGHFAVRNDRCEFDASLRSWVELDPDRDDSGPWRRCGLYLFPDPADTKLFLVGGRGSRSGEQGVSMAGVRAFDGQFHLLDDIWELDLKANAWRCLLPVGHLNPTRLRAAAYLPALEGLVVFEGLHPGMEPGPAQTWLFRPDVDRKPMRLPAEGEPSHLTSAWSWTLDPHSGELILLADDGIFRISAREI